MSTRRNPNLDPECDVRSRPSDETINQIRPEKLARICRDIVVTAGEVLVLDEVLYCGTLLIEEGGIVYLNGFSLIAVYRIDGSGTIVFGPPPCDCRG